MILRIKGQMRCRQVRMLSDKWDDFFLIHQKNSIQLRNLEEGCYGDQ